MPHANVIDNTYVDDDFQAIDGPEFESPRPQTFRDHIAELAEQRQYVQPGWKKLFEQTLVKLKAVDCPQRENIELSEIAFGDGEMIVAAQGGGTDRVVWGILNRLRQASASTCACCGTRYGAIYRRECGETLCNRCQGHTHLEQVLDGILNGLPAYTQVPLIEWDALPVNIQALIPPGQVKVVHLPALGVRIRYVEPTTLQGLRQPLTVLKQALKAHRGW